MIDLTIGDFQSLANLAASQVDEAGRVIGSDTAAAAVLNLYGVTLTPVRDADREALRRRGIDGVLIDSVRADGPARAARLRAGDLLMQVGGEPVRTPAQAVAALAQGNSEGRGVTVRVYRDSDGQIGETVIRP